ncbi:adenylate cyclase [Halobiforma lacisalsi AJ5]|uniref:Adenylate cyclase n=1 Tax=Natronobacterium lacisalsi AJ5 TaxID=358396 RepID=M0LDM2_NATLA|nr:class IV adenylate cyclase [Halobiforma lacisalsi]APW99099.1 adenylate cyclase [Halobiforma lacisalsi AJ5]EMA31218.1 adenylyl cyclase CyaB [Halobiforma lacisalsi AJ5]
MYEVEVKVPADLQRVREQLESLEAGARPLESVVQVDTYYDAPHRSFPETDEALRIRSERTVSEADVVETEPSQAEESERDDDRTKLTYKGPLVDDESKTREEVETLVGDRTAMDALLTNLGFDPAATVRKSRDRYAVSVADLEFEDTAAETLLVTLDEVDGVGEYVEVETEIDDEGDLEAAREAAYALLERLGLDPDDGVRTSYLGLLLERS